MPPSSVPGPSVAAFTSQCDQYLLRVRGSAASTRRLHRYVSQRWLTSRFPNGVIVWSDLRFSDCAAFVRTEFGAAGEHGPTNWGSLSLDLQRRQARRRPAASPDSRHEVWQIARRRAPSINGGSVADLPRREHEGRCGLLGPTSAARAAHRGSADRSAERVPGRCQGPSRARSGRRGQP